MSKKFTSEDFLKFYKKLEDEDKRHKIFYYSLFDGSSWEELSKKDVSLKKEFRELEKEIKEHIIDTLPSKIKKKINKEDFIKRYVYTDWLCKQILSFELRKKGIDCRVEEDIIIPTKNITIEIKRPVSGSQMKKIVEEIVEKFKNSSNKFLILFIFPQVGNENPARLSQLIEINYIVEDYLKVKLGKLKVICQYITKEYKEGYNLDYLLERLKKDIKPLEENNFRWKE